ncbi:hypothetical protein DSECCO2_471970 [anaerobic digester metagenome]
MESLFFSFGFLAEIVELFGGIKSIIGITSINELHGILMIHRFALALAVRAEGTTDMRSFVEVDSAPGEAFNNVFFGAFHKARLIGIFDAEDEFSAILFRKKTIIKRRSHTAYVQRTCGAGRKTYTNHNSEFGVQR